MKRILNFVTLASMLFAMESCRKQDIDPDSDLSADKPFYKLYIIGAGGAGSENNTKTIIGENIQATWDDDLGLIWLGTDSKNLPVATITMQITQLFGDGEGIAENIYISTTDVLIGTSEELNAKLYFAGLEDIENVEVGTNFIKGELKNVAFQEVNTLEKVRINCQFIAMNYN
ncbi:MAG: hypothetical protein IH594_06250 [Bacteroidales bacterium]|nr:hypothetical protein [Bacteroidales bacterium]